MNKSRKYSQILEERRKRLLSVIESEFSSNAEFCREMDLSHNWVNYFKTADEPPAIHDRILSSLYESKGINPLWVISGVGERKILPEQPRQGKAEPEEQYRSKFMQVGRLIQSIEQKPDALKDTLLLGDLARECAQLTAKLLELQHKVQSEGD